MVMRYSAAASVGSPSPLPACAMTPIVCPSTLDIRAGDRSRTAVQAPHRLTERDKMPLACVNDAAPPASRRRRMDRYDPDERPSIFPHSEDELDDPRPASSESLATYVDGVDGDTMRPISPRTGWSSTGPANGPSRRFMVAIAAGGILIIGLIGYVGASVLRLADDPGNAAASGTPGGSFQVSATPSPSPSSTPLAAHPSSSAGPSPTLRPQPATPLLAGQWATVVTDLVNLRSTPRLVASVVGEAGRGEIVFVLASEAPVEVDGFTWYPVVADPNEVGWVAGHGPTEQLLRSDAPSADLTWCGLPTAPVFDMRDLQMGSEAVVAGLPVPTDLLGRTAASAIELMWGAEFPVCVSLTIA